MNLSDFEGLLAGHLKKLAGVHAVGDKWFGWDPKEAPAGVQLCSGQLVSRAAYSKHWDLVNSGKRTLVTEVEWQAYVAAHGHCPWFSTGDGSTTYRWPLIKGVHPKFVAALAEAGQHVAAGVPNITGTASARDSRMGEVTSGAFYQGPEQAGFWFYQNGSSPSECFDASRCSSVYRDDIDTVQPEALTMVVGEWVVGVSMPIGTSDAESLLASVTQLESNVGALQNGVGRASAYIVEKWSSGTSWYRKWSDGWIEQGGRSDTDKIVTLVTPFTTTTYNVHVTTGWDGTDTAGAASFAPVVSVKKTTQFYCGNYNGQESDWHAYGY